MVINEVKKLFKGTDDKQDDFGWNEFSLEELRLPSADKILKGVKNIESKLIILLFLIKMKADIVKYGAHLY